MANVERKPYWNQELVDAAAKKRKKEETIARIRKEGKIPPGTAWSHDVAREYIRSHKKKNT
jgi:hypothetical protein